MMGGIDGQRGRRERRTIYQQARGVGGFGWRWHWRWHCAGGRMAHVSSARGTVERQRHPQRRPLTPFTPSPSPSPSHMCTASVCLTLVLVCCCYYHYPLHDSRRRPAIGCVSLFHRRRGDGAEDGRGRPSKKALDEDGMASEHRLPVFQKPPSFFSLRAPCSPTQGRRKHQSPAANVVER